MKYIRSYPELFVLIFVTFACYLFLETQIDGMAFGRQGNFSSVDIIVMSFLISVLIAIIAVIAGVGGGGLLFITSWVRSERDGNRDGRGGTHGTDGTDGTDRAGRGGSV